MIKQFFRDIGALLLGMFTVFKHSFKHRVTGEFPEVKPTLPDRFRGLHQWDKNKCIGCKMCMKTCPTGALIIQNENGNISFRLDLNKCIFCGNCMYYCPNKAINMSDEYTLAIDKHKGLIIEINSLNSSNESNIIKGN